MIDFDKLMTEREMSKADYVVFVLMVFVSMPPFLLPLFVGAHYNDELITPSIADYTIPLFIVSALILLALSVAGRRALVRYKLFRAIWLFVCVWVPLNINSDYSQLYKMTVYLHAESQYPKIVVAKSVTVQGTRGGPRYLLHVNPYDVSSDAEINISKETFNNLVKSSPRLLSASGEAVLSPKCYIEATIRRLGTAELVIGTSSKPDGTVLYKCER